MINIATLVELYKIALEEARHYERLSLQIWVSIAVVYALISAFAFYFREGLIDSLHPVGSWLVVSSLGSVVAVGSMWLISNYEDGKFICRGIARKIEGILKVMSNETPEACGSSVSIDKLLITEETQHLQGPVWIPSWEKGRRMARLGSLFVLLLFLAIWWGVWWWAFV